MHYFQPRLPWQVVHWQRLTARFPQIPHAILLSGMAGTGKRLFADQLAAWILCQHRQAEYACGECISCQWLKANTHPNLLKLSPEVDAKGKQSQFIKIDQVRELMPFVQQTVEGWRVVIIEPAESLNTAAANALLKTLEEPGERVTLILVADQSLQLPATIRSRLQQFKVGQVDPTVAVDYVMSQEQMNAQQAALLIGLSGGSPLSALALKATQTFQSRQDWLADWQRLLTQRVSPIQLSSQWQSKLSLDEFLQLLQWTLRDVVAVHMQQPVIQQDLDFQAVVALTQLPPLFAIQHDIMQIYQTQGQNIQAALIYDNLMMKLMLL